MRFGKDKQKDRTLIDNLQRENQVIGENVNNDNSYNRNNYNNLNILNHTNQILQENNMNLRMQHTNDFVTKQTGGGFVEENVEKLIMKENKKRK